MSVNWTPEQKRAIELPSGKGNILVSAAAGSGKTAVLVERIFDKISKERTDIDSFLVVTFTNAAALGMKNKIQERFLKELTSSQTDEDKKFWKKQLTLLPLADITTIDSFCMNVLRNNFHQAGIDSGFFIMDDAEYKLLRDNITEELFEKLYQEKNERFLSLVEKYAGFRDDVKLVSLIYQIHDFVLCFAEPQKWLLEKAAMYKEDMRDSEWTRLCINLHVKNIAKDMEKRAHYMLNDIVYSALGINEDYFGLKHSLDDVKTNYCEITDSLENICTGMKELQSVSDFDGLCEWMKKYSCGEAVLCHNFPAKINARMKTIEGFDGYLKATRKLHKDITSELAPVAYKTPEEYLKNSHGKELSQTANDLAWLVTELDNAIKIEKNRRNSYGFSDVEHMTYELFTKNESIRQGYTEKYNEILIDEYQDTNGLQDAIFQSISKNNIFMVGDLKQSIYRFRGGDPFIFKEKSDTYNSEETDDISGTKIDLSRNFRSRSEIINSVNEIFDAVMSEKTGDVNYSEGERLASGVDNKTTKKYRSELHIIENVKSDFEDDEDEEIDRIEAEHIAKQIKKLYHTSFYDTKLGKTRPLEYRDFTILLRSIKNKDEIYAQAFEKYDIPLMTEYGDYFENIEIKIMTALIKVIDNAHCDIPLFAVLRSPIFNFTDSEIADIKISFKGDCLYERMLECSKTKTYLGKRSEDAIKAIERWRGYMKYMSVAELIWTIYEETGFYDRASVLGSDSAQENLRLFYRRAKQYEKSGFKGLFSFTRYIENLKDRNQDIKGARIVKNNTVTLMTIHKSKGLEFPVVFVGGMAKKSLALNSDGDARVMLHKDLGMGLMYPDTENEIYQFTLYKHIVAMQNKREELSEKMRILYVALTRAQYKLIITAAYNFKDEDALSDEQEKWKSKLEGNRMNDELVLSATHYTDWIIPAAMSGNSWEVKEFRIKKKSKKEESEQTDIAQNADNYDALKEAVDKLLDYKYPYIKSTVIPSRTTATELKSMQYEKNKPHTYHITSKPLFMSDKKNAAKRGTAYHNFIAYIDLDKMRYDCSKKSVNDELKRLIDEGYVSKDDIDDLAAEKILKYFNSPIGKRMLNAREIYREKNFQSVIASSVYDDETDGEEMILQGVIDCYFIEDNGNVILVDYKTDKIINGDVTVAVNNYTLQLELYSKAIENVAGKKVNEKYLYLFDIDEAIKA